MTAFINGLLRFLNPITCSHNKLIKSELVVNCKELHNNNNYKETRSILFLLSYKKLRRFFFFCPLPLKFPKINNIIGILSYYYFDKM